MRKTLAFLLALLMLLPLASCATPKEPSASAASSDIIDSDELTNLAYSTRQGVSTYASDSAYVRGGTYGDQNFAAEIKSSEQLILKTVTGSGGYDRSMLLKFDISKMKMEDMKSVYIYLQAANSGTAEVTDNQLYILAYTVSDDWKSDTVTWNNAPTFTEDDYAGRGYAPSKGTVQIDVSEAVFAAYEQGDKEISFRIVGSERMGGGEGKYSAHTCANYNARPKLVAKTTSGDFPYEKNVLEYEGENKVLWDYAQKMYDEWYARYQDILKAGDYEYETVKTNPADYTTKVTARAGNGSGNVSTYDTRLVSDLDGFTEKVYEVDRFGGAISAEKQEATGYYYTKKIGDRWWVVDPLGNLTHLHGTSHFKYAYINTAEAQKEAALRVFGSYEKWAIAATRWAMDDLYFNVAHAVSDETRGVEHSMPITGSFNGINSYSSSIGAIIPNGGGVPQFVGGAMPVFDPEFETYVESSVIKKVEEYKGRDDVIGYISDNEVLMSDTMLASYLNLDHTMSLSVYSYACAWTWYINMTGEEAPRIQDIDKYCEELGVDLWDLFKGFIYDRYYKVCVSALRKHDTNRMYLGNRFLIDCDKWEWITRFTGYWCDIMCINYYHVWEIESDRAEKEGPPTLNQLGAWLGIPFVITEFYSKGNDSFDANGTPMNNNGGAGWVVDTQKERGYFYQNFTLKLLQCKNNVGWFQFQFIDNDPTDPIGAPAAAQSSNKGIVNWNQDFEIYSDFTEQLAMLHKNTYALIEYFDSVDYIK